MIKFITDQPSQAKTPRFEDVSQEQFFIDRHGRLSQKVSYDSYTTIADCDQRPLASFHEGISNHDPITRILPTVTKIEF